MIFLNEKRDRGYAKGFWFSVRDTPSGEPTFALMAKTDDGKYVHITIFGDGNVMVRPACTSSWMQFTYSELENQPQVERLTVQDGKIAVRLKPGYTLAGKEQFSFDSMQHAMAQLTEVTHA